MLVAHYDKNCQAEETNLESLLLHSSSWSKSLPLCSHNRERLLLCSGSQEHLVLRSHDGERLRLCLGNLEHLLLRSDCRLPVRKSVSILSHVEQPTGHDRDVEIQSI